MSHAPAIDVAAWASAWRWRSPGDKILLSGGLVVTALVLPPWPACPVITVAAVGLLLGPARVPARVLGRAVRAAAAFIVLGAVTIAVTWRTGGDGFGPTVTAASLTDAAETFAHAVAGTSAVLLLAATTPMPDLIAWARRRGLPDALAEVVGLMYRLLFLLMESLHAVRAAQAARLGYANRRAALRSASALGAAVLLRSFDRARRIEDGLAARGFEGSLQVLDDERPSSSRFVAVTLAGLVACVAGCLALRAAGWPG